VRALRLAAQSTGALLVAALIAAVVVVGSSFFTTHQLSEGALAPATRTASVARVRAAAPKARRSAAARAKAKSGARSKPKAAVTARHTPAPEPVLTNKVLGPGDTGSLVLALQQRLTALGYWVGTPDGYYGDSTIQAVYALQKAAGLTRDGVAGPETERALAERIVPKALPYKGYVIEVNLADDILLFVDNGRIEWILNTSTGGGYTYWNSGEQTAVTPTGVFHIYAAIDRMVTDSLGQLYMPRYFIGGYAIHGEGYVPAYPVSHGCVRVSDEAITWIWAENLAPIGTTVWIYG
jgi:N-acetylmuramoyl-L-alanine amidase